MLVKCQLCGNKIDRDMAYKRVVGTSNKYYCSEAEYLAEEARKAKEVEDKDRVYKLICEIIGKKEIVNTALYKEWKQWSKVADNIVIAQYLTENRDYLAKMISKLDGGEYNRIRYLSVVLCNNLGDFKPKIEEKIEKRVVVEEHYETKYKPKARQALADLEEDCYE